MKNFGADNNINFSNMIAAWANEIILDQGDPSHAIIPRETLKKKIQFEIESSLQQFTERVTKGVTTLLTELELLAQTQPDQINREAIEEFDKLTHEPIDEAESSRQLQEGQNFKDIYQISENTFEACYRVATELYNHQKYEEASNVFFVLSLLQPQNDTFWLGLGHSEYFQKRFEEALKAYTIAAFANPTNPQCHFYAAHCYEDLGQVDLAINSIEIALFVIRSDSTLQDWENSATEYLNTLNASKKAA